MAPISNASRLADFGTGIGTQGAGITVDNTNKRLGVDQSSPVSTFQVGESFNVTSAGIITAAGINVTGSSITGVGTQGLNVQAQSITVAGISTFADDVRVLAGGLDVVGVVTSNNKVVATGLDIGTAGVDIDGQTDLDELQVAGVSTFSAKAVFNTAYPSIDADNELQVGTAIQLGKAGIVTALGLDISTGGVDIDGQTDLDELVVAGVTTASNNVNVSGGTITVGTGITIAAVAGLATFSSGVKLKAGGGGVLCEGISSVTAGFDNTSDLNLDNGMVHYTSDALAGNANTLNITSSVGINTAMAVNDMIVVTGITSVSSTSHYVNAITIDHNPPRQISWVGGTAPTAGGSTGFDTYTFTIWKTGNGGGGVTSGQFMVIANHVKTTA